MCLSVVRILVLGICGFGFFEFASTVLFYQLAIDLGMLLCSGIYGWACDVLR